MNKEEIKKMLKDRGALAEKALGTYHQLQGQMSLLRDMLIELEKEDMQNKKKDPEKKPVEQ